MKRLLITVTATLVCVGAFGQGKLMFQLNTDQLIYFTTDRTHLMPADAGTVVAGYPLPGSGLYLGYYQNNGSTPGTIMSLAGSPSFIATLYGGTSSSSLSLLTTTTIGNYGSEGQLNAVFCTFANLPAGVPAWFQVQVYDSRATSTEEAWGIGLLYAGESPVFEATPQSSVYYPIYRTASPVNSTLPQGTFNLTDYPGAMGLIPVYATLGTWTPEPSTLALFGWGAAALMIARRRKQSSLPTNRRSFTGCAFFIAPDLRS